MENLNAFERLVSVMDYILASKRRRHIVGGGLLSMAALFAGLAVTAMTLRSDEDEIEVTEDDFDE